MEAHHHPFSTIAMNTNPVSAPAFLPMQVAHPTEQQQHQHIREPSPPRKRTRATPEQLAILEKTFSFNSAPNSRIREQLSRQLGMTERSIQIWFQNRRAKEKTKQKRNSMLQDQTLRMQHFAAAAATAACQAAAYQPQCAGMDPKDMYYYYYYYYYNQQQQYSSSYPTSRMPEFVPPPMGLLPPPPPPPPPPVPVSSTSTSSQQSDASSSWSLTSPPPPPLSMVPENDSNNNNPTFRPPKTSQMAATIAASGRVRSQSVGPYPSYYSYHHWPGNNKPYHHERHASMGPPVGSVNFPPSLEEDPITGYTFQGINHSLGTGTNATATSCCDHSVDEAHQLALSVDALQIGTWKRMMLRPHDLVCHYDQKQQILVWCVRDGDQCFKMIIPLSSVQCIRLLPHIERHGHSYIELHLSQPESIAFYMSQGENGWTQCRDFTQDRQATVELIHRLEGPTLALRSELAHPHLEPLMMNVLYPNDMLKNNEISTSSISNSNNNNGNNSSNSTTMLSLLGSGGDDLLFQA
ncbi:hypothetical protein EC973_009622 [Apophysomyces ossiformis]|uniref:Homeobox domain-containing protein n=1 Tax=Apophysomyces ossiformis TaxID=679940 RepID=A0A8H7BJJ3_9FUNG|nr:hypothetical protein EC973_009622 [Apophysomyces ossiformis]